MTKGKQFRMKLALICFGLVIGVSIAELGFRVIGYSYPGFYMPDATRGHALIPGMEGWYRKEGAAYVRINSAGQRDRERTRAKPADTVRIAVIGDSYAEALQVPIEQAFWAIMEEKLRGNGYASGKQIEVLNFGVSGYGTAAELLTLRERVWDYSPDIVLLAVTTNNDVSDNSRELKKTDEAPYFVYRDGQLTLDDSFKTSRAFRLRQSTLSRFGRWIKDHSRCLQAINEAHRGFKTLLASWRSKPNTPSVDPTGTQADVSARSEELGIDNLIYIEPHDRVWNEAWRVTEGLILVMRDEVSAHGAKLVVVTLSNGPQVLPDPKARQAFMKRLGVDDLFYPDNRIKSLCLREHIPAITLVPELQAYAEKSGSFLHGFGSDLGNGHWNPVGHRVAGEMIAEKLKEGVLGK
jgi:lysophospholipase L1-like esterase